MAFLKQWLLDYEIHLRDFNMNQTAKPPMATPAAP
jgi:hypothetical protein